MEYHSLFGLFCYTSGDMHSAMVQLLVSFKWSSVVCVSSTDASDIRRWNATKWNNTDASNAWCSSRHAVWWRDHTCNTLTSRFRSLDEFGYGIKEDEGGWYYWWSTLFRVGSFHFRGMFTAVSKSAPTLLGLSIVSDWLLMSKWVLIFGIPIRQGTPTPSQDILGHGN